jgi:hypothetical protein
MTLKRIFKNFGWNLFRDPVGDLVNELLDSEQYPGSMHKCPKCGGHFYFYLTLLKQRHPAMAAVQAWCSDCKTKIAIDGIVSPPIWAERATQIWHEQLNSKDIN